MQNPKKAEFACGKQLPRFYIQAVSLFSNVNKIQSIIIVNYNYKDAHTPD